MAAHVDAQALEALPPKPPVSQQSLKTEKTLLVKRLSLVLTRRTRTSREPKRAGDETRHGHSACGPVADRETRFSALGHGDLGLLERAGAGKQSRT